MRTVIDDVVDRTGRPMLLEMIELIHLYEVRNHWSTVMEIPVWSFTVLATGRMRRTWLDGG